MPFILIISLWCVGIKYKYGRFTFSDSQSWNYSLFVENSIGCKEAKERGRKRIPQYGTYWWSDIGASLYDWDFKSKFDFKKQIRCLYGNINYFITNDVKKDIFIKIIIVLSIIYLIVLTYKFRKKDINEKFLGFVGVSILLIYAQISLQTRFFPFVLLFLLPILGISIDKNKFINNNVRIATIILVTIAILHGILVMIVASVLEAPNDAHFKIKKVIIKNGYNYDSNAFIGAYLKNRYIDHHAIIAFLLKTKTAEINSNDNSLSNFTASFVPQYVLIEANRYNILNKVIAVNGKYFKQLCTTEWKKGEKASKLGIYEKLDLVHKFPN